MMQCILGQELNMIGTIGTQYFTCSVHVLFWLMYSKKKHSSALKSFNLVTHLHKCCRAKAVHVGT